MKVVIEVDNSKLVKGDLLYFNGKELVGFNKDAIIDDLTKRVKGLEIELAQFKEAVNHYMLSFDYQQHNLMRLE